MDVLAQAHSQGQQSDQERIDLVRHHIIGIFPIDLEPEMRVLLFGRETRADT